MRSAGYQAAQRAFEACQAGYDPNAIAALLQHNPYHLDSLLTMCAARAAAELMLRCHGVLLWLWLC